MMNIILAGGQFQLIEDNTSSIFIYLQTMRIKSTRSLIKIYEIKYCLNFGVGQAK